MANHGTETKDKIHIPYGKDSSEFVGKAKDERIPGSIGGSTSNIEHSISGGGAKQSQR